MWDRAFTWWTLVALVVSPGIGLADDAPIEVTYVANEGFLISSGGEKVLIDALHDGGIEQYREPSAGTLSKLRQASGEFAGVQLVLSSHHHVDHFDADMIAAHLASNPDAFYISSSEMTELVHARVGDRESAKMRIQTVPYLLGPGNKLKKVGDIEVRLFRLDHGGYPKPRYRFHHLGHIVTLRGMNFLHVGDADISVSNFGPYRDLFESIDVAFIPYWYLIDPVGRRIVRSLIRPGKIVAMHIPPRELAKQTVAIRQEFPDAVIFERSMETKSEWK